jgi:hypothetical protein
MVYLIQKSGGGKNVITELSKSISSLIYNNLDIETKTRYIDQGIGIIDLEKRLKVIFIYILLFPILALAAYITNGYYEIGLSVIFVSLIRIWNGGHHFKPDICLIVTSGVILGIPLIAYLLQGHILILWLIAMIPNILLAPFDKQTNKAKIKKIVSVCVCFSAYFINDLLTVSFFVLSFDLIKWGKVGD